MEFKLSEDGYRALVPKKDAAELSRKLNEAMQDPEFRAKINKQLSDFAFQMLQEKLNKDINGEGTETPTGLL